MISHTIKCKGKQQTSYSEAFNWSMCCTLSNIAYIKIDNKLIKVDEKPLTHSEYRNVSMCQVSNRSCDVKYLRNMELVVTLCC